MGKAIGDLGMRRRGVLLATAGAGALAVVGAPFVNRGALGQSAFDPKRFKGQKIEVLHAKGPRGALLQQYE